MFYIFIFFLNNVIGHNLIFRTDNKKVIITKFIRAKTWVLKTTRINVYVNRKNSVNSE